MIRIENLTKRYRSRTVLRDLSLDIAQGESVALWGPNGAGKTTVVRCILGLVAYDGTVEVNGLDARRRGKAVRSLIGYVPQELSFYADMAVIDVLDYSAELRRLPRERVDEVLEIIDLEDHAHKKVRELSGGLKQRLGIAAALLPDPPILLLDEPTSSLDAASRDKAVRLIEELRHDGRTLIVTSHHLEEVGMLVDRVVALEDGAMIAECSPLELAERLGLRAWLHVITAPGSADEAVRVLTAHGFDAHLNSHGVLVEVPAQSKGDAMAVLLAAGLTIEDIEVWR